MTGPAIVLELGPPDFAVFAWVRDRRGVPVYRVTQPEIKAAAPGDDLLARADGRT